MSRFYFSNVFYSASALFTMYRRAVIATTDLSVRLFVCPSVTFRCFVKRNKDVDRAVFSVMYDNYFSF